MATNTRDLTSDRHGWIIYNPKGKHYFRAYDGNGGYYAARDIFSAYLFASAKNAVAMAKRLRGKTLIVAHAEISACVGFSCGVSVQAEPLTPADRP